MNDLTVRIAEDKPNIPPRQISLQTNCKMTTNDISTQLQCNKDMTIGSMFRLVSSPTPPLRQQNQIKKSISWKGPDI